MIYPLQISIQWILRTCECLATTHLQRSLTENILTILPLESRTRRWRISLERTYGKSSVLKKSVAGKVCTSLQIELVIKKNHFDFTSRKLLFQPLRGPTGVVWHTKSNCRIVPFSCSRQHFHLQQQWPSLHRHWCKSESRVCSLRPFLKELLLWDSLSQRQHQWPAIEIILVSA